MIIVVFLAGWFLSTKHLKNEAATFLGEIESGIASLVDRMPTHTEFLRRFCPPQASSRPAATMETAR